MKGDDEINVEELMNDFKSSKIWQQEFENLEDVVENGILKSEFIPPISKVVSNLTVTSDFILKVINKSLMNFDLSMPQKNVLEALFFCRSNSMNQSQLSKFIFSSNSNLSTLLNRMEKKGLIERFVDSDNRREKKVKITDIGILKLRESVSNIVGADFLNAITKDEADEFNRILKKIKVKFLELEENL